MGYVGLREDWEILIFVGKIQNNLLLVEDWSYVKIK
jgi:hypothetical protein